MSATTPSFPKRALSFAYSAVTWARAGFKVVSNEEFQKRRKICSSCEFFDPNAYFGDGGCKLCGCDFSMKSKMATTSCDIGKWGTGEAVKV